MKLGIRSCLVTTVLAVLMNPAPAIADEPNSDRAIVLGDTQIAAGSAEVVSEREFDLARELAHDNRSPLPSSVEDAIAEEVAEASASEGTFVNEDEVDVVPLFDGDVVVGIPDETEVEQVRIVASEDGTEINASLETTQASGAPETTASGPGMALSWADNGGGSYVIKIFQKGDLKIDGRFTWRRYKLMGDGDPNLVHYAYKRHGDAQPSSESGPDPRVLRLRIQNFPYDEVERHLRAWDRYSPGSDRQDNCNTYNASISIGVASLSVPFDEGCGEYDMWRNLDKPSSYWLEYHTGGLNPRGGNREVGYVIAWSQKQGTPGSQHDLQLIRLGWPAYYWGAYETCKQTDASRSC